MPEQDLERALAALGREIEYPPTPDLAAAVRPRVGPQVERQLSGWRPLRLSLPAALIGLLVLAGAALAVSIGLRGLGIVFVETPAPSPAGAELDLGERLTLAEAQLRVPYRVLVPAALGEPDEVYLDERGRVQQVSLVYRSGESLMLVTQFVAEPDTDAVIKEVGEGTAVQPVTVGGEPGLWITGEPHALFYVDARGVAMEDRVRVVGDVLAWQDGEITLRLEGASSLDEALEVARSVE